MTANLLAAVKLFATVPPAELEDLARDLRPCRMPAGAVLFREGEQGDHFYVVAAGRVEVIKALGTPEERQLDVRGPGDFVGEMSLLNRDGLRTATVRVAETADLLEVRRADFDRLLHRHPLLGYEMVRLFSSRLTQNENIAIASLREKNAQLQSAFDALQAAQAQIVEKERLDRELQLAHEIQMGLLPQALPLIPGYTFGARTRPARAVGGDLYDLIRLDDGSISVVIGDVAGKGMPAALFMAQILALLRAECRREAPPAEVLRRVNAHLLHFNRAELFVTALLARLDLDTGRLQYARAGHETPLLALGGPSHSLPYRRGQPLAVFDHIELDEAELDLPPGAALLFYTDGVNDARSPTGETYGVARLQDALTVEAAEGHSAQMLCDRLLARVSAHQRAAAQHDDITLVALRRE